MWVVIWAEIDPRLLNNVKVNTLLLSSMVNRHIAKNAKAKLRNLWMMFLKNAFITVFKIQNFSKLEDRFFPKKGFYTFIAKGQINKSFQQIDQILRVFLLH